MTTGAGRRVLLLDQEPEQSLGGQAWWSFGGLFFVDSPEQRRLRVRDSVELAWRDWVGTAGFDRAEDEWPRKWARAYVEWAATEKQPWLAAMGHSVVPVVGWAERGGYDADGPGNSVPRFHITWGTGPGVVEPFERRVRAAAEAGRLEFRFRHRVDEVTVTNGTVDGVAGTVLEPSDVPRGQPSSRQAVGDFEFRAQAVIVTSGGIGGNHDMVRQAWPERLGTPPKVMLSGVPAHVDGRMIAIAEQAGGAVINRDRMWHYTEGITNWSPVWPLHGIRILPGPSPLWLDATGRRLPAPLYPGSDTLGPLEYLQSKGLLAPVSKSTLAQTPARYSSPHGDWVAVSARVSVLVYNPALISARQLPTSVLQLADSKYRGKLALAPGETDFQPIVTSVLRAYGQAATLRWLAGLKANAAAPSSNRPPIANRMR